jgi:CheY-like chemotaxis protein
MFDMFVQVDRSLEKSQGGLGVGLGIVKRLVELHGGTVEAHSAGPGHGSEFVVRLPVPRDEGGGMKDESEPAAPASAQPSSLRLHPSRRVLVVDDNADGAATTAALLGLMGHEVRTAGDGEEGVAAAAAFRPDVVLLDIGMPRLNGYDAARRIRELPGGRGVVLVALTGWGQEEDRRKSREAGFDHHLTKPVDPQDLGKLLASLPPRAD